MSTSVSMLSCSQRHCFLWQQMLNWIFYLEEIIMAQTVKCWAGHVRHEISRCSKLATEQETISHRILHNPSCTFVVNNPHALFWYLFIFRSTIRSCAKNIARAATVNFWPLNYIGILILITIRQNIKERSTCQLQNSFYLLRWHTAQRGGKSVPHLWSFKLPARCFIYIVVIPF